VEAVAEDDTVIAPITNVDTACELSDDAREEPAVQASEILATSHDLEESKDQKTNDSKAESSTAQPAPEGDIAEYNKEVVTDQQKSCQICGRPMILKKDQFGKFWDCSGFPACRHSESYRSTVEELINCPVCQTAKVLSKRTPTGKPFYVCIDDSCDFMAWSKPHALPCLVCGSPYLVEKKSASGVLHLRCPRAGCNFGQVMPGEDGSELIHELKKSAKTVKAKAGKTRPRKRKVRVVRRRK